MQKVHNMTDDSMVSSTDTSDLASTSVDTHAVSQADTGTTAAAGSTSVDTPASADAAPSQPNASSTATPDPLDKVGTFAHGNASNLTQKVTPPVTQAAPPTWDQISAKLGIKDPKELDRLAGMTTLYGRQTNELGQMRQQVAALQQEQQAATQRAQEEAQRAQLSPFHSRHPQHQQNTARVQAFSAFKSALQGLPPELQNDPGQRSRLAAAMGVSADDEKLYKQQETYSHQVRQELESDPDAFVERRLERRVNERFQQFEQYLEAKHGASALVQQHQPLIEKHGERMNWILDPNVPARDKAIWAAQQEEKMAELMATKVPEAQQNETLKARNQLAVRQVAPTRTAAAVAPNPFAQYEKDKRSNPNAQESLKDALFGKVD